MALGLKRRIKGQRFTGSLQLHSQLYSIRRHVYADEPWAIFCAILVRGLIFLMLPTFLSAQEQESPARPTGPERGIGVFTEYSGVTVGRGEPVRMDLILLEQGADG